MNRPSVYDHVGPVLEAGEAGSAVAAAIRDSTPGAVVQDRGGYLRVLAPLRCSVTREAIERRLARPFRLPGDLEALMPAFKGRFEVTDDLAVWSVREPT